MLSNWKRGIVTLALLPALLALGCSDDSGSKDSGTKSDGMDAQVLDSGTDSVLPADQMVADMAPVENNMGEGCSSPSDCKKGSPLCLLLSQEKGLGVCSMECTPDDASTPLINEDNCPTDFTCASFRFTTATYNYCLKTCKPSLTTNSCPASSKQACSPLSTRFGSTDQAVCWYLACETNKDCPVFTGPTCIKDSDCGSGEYCETSTKKCAKEGVCSASGLCGPHTLGKADAKVGDPCLSDLDCPNNGTCFQETTDSTAIGAQWHNGYCTISGCAFATDLPEFACPTGSTCFNLYYGGICAKSCALDGATDCRNNPTDKGGDYECYAWSNFSIGGLPVADGPVCISAAGTTCDSVGAQSDCTALGEQGNPTNMGCRDRHTGAAKANAVDPGGVCLDDTASGPFDTPPADGGTPDAMTPDAGVPDATPAADAMVPDSAPAVDSAPVVDGTPAADGAPAPDQMPSGDL